MQHASRCLTAQGLGTVHHHDDLARSSCRIFHHFKVGAFHDVKAYIPSAWMLLRSLDFFWSNSHYNERDCGSNILDDRLQWIWVWRCRAVSCNIFYRDDAGSRLTKKNYSHPPFIMY